MRKYILPTKDTSIYQAYPDKNTGIDEILEVGKILDPTTGSYASSSVRSLLAFDVSAFQSITGSVSYFLNLKIANAEKLARGQQLLILPVSSSWDEGSGYFNQTTKQTNDGATWTQSTRNTSWSMAGGATLGSPTASVSLSNFPVSDVRVDITNLVTSASVATGILVKFPDTDESDIQNEGVVKFFSAQTHTIYSPTIEVVWDSQTFSTGSLQPIPSLDVKVSVKGAAETYIKGDIVKLVLSVRDQYPIKAFDATPRYGNKYYLPVSTYFSIVDEQTKETVIQGDQYSPVECDGASSYIILDTSPLYVGRFYRLKLHLTQNGLQRTVDPNIMFRIV